MLLLSSFKPHKQNSLSGTLLVSFAIADPEHTMHISLYQVVIPAMAAFANLPRQPKHLLYRATNP
jgi:hypothetical protein